MKRIWLDVAALWVMVLLPGALMAKLLMPWGILVAASWGLLVGTLLQADNRIANRLRRALLYGLLSWRMYSEGAKDRACPYCGLEVPVLPEGSSCIACNQWIKLRGAEEVLAKLITGSEWGHDWEVVEDSEGKLGPYRVEECTIHGERRTIRLCKVCRDERLLFVIEGYGYICSFCYPKKEVFLGVCPECGIVRLPAELVLWVTTAKGRELAGGVCPNCHRVASAWTTVNDEGAIRALLKRLKSRYPNAQTNLTL